MAAEWFHPIVDAESEPFWKAAREGKLLLKLCRACDNIYFYPRRLCPRCWSENIEWIESTRRGTIYSCSTVRQNPAQPFSNLCPYGVVLVDLEEGPRMMANWDFSTTLDQMKCGLSIEVLFRKVSDELSLPIIRPRV